MTFQQVTLVVPLTPNVGGHKLASDADAIRAGRHQHRENLAQLERELIATFGGFTAVDGRGAWEDGSVVLHEDVRVYTLAVPSVLTAPCMSELRERVKVLLDQRTVYLAAYDLAEKPVW